MTVSILAVLGAVYTGFRVNGFLRRSGGLCCELHVRSCHSSMPLPLCVCLPCSLSNTLLSFFPSLLPFSFLLPLPPPLLSFSSLSPLSLPLFPSPTPLFPSSLFFSSPVFLSQTFIYMMVEVCSASSTAILILLAAACTFWLIFFKVRHTVKTTPRRTNILYHCTNNGGASVPPHTCTPLRRSPRCSSACLLGASCWCFKSSSALHYSSE